MKNTYNALDNVELAKQFREKLIMEQQDIGSSLQYEYATSYCDDCPRREREPQSYSEQEFGVYYAPSCCKEDGTFEEQNAGSIAKMEQISTLLRAVSAYLDEDKKLNKSWIVETVDEIIAEEEAGKNPPGISDLPF